DGYGCNWSEGAWMDREHIRSPRCLLDDDDNLGFGASTIVAAGAGKTYRHFGQAAATVDPGAHPRQVIAIDSAVIVIIVILRGSEPTRIRYRSIDWSGVMPLEEDCLRGNSSTHLSEAHVYRACPPNLNPLSRVGPSFRLTIWTICDTHCNE